MSTAHPAPPGAPGLDGVRRERLACVASTNTELLERARAGDIRPTLLLADTQTRGRGRMGRAWHSAPGASLTFSLGLPLAPPDWSGLSLAVGVALAEALHPRVALKWPNDLWLDGRKLGGILIETSSTAGAAARHCVIGIGLNLQAPPADADFATPPAWLRELCPEADAAGTLDALAPGLLAAVRQFEQSGFAPFAPRYAARDALAGRPVWLSDGSRGEALGVAADGALRLRTDAGLRLVTSAEVSVRPAPAA